jgi:hypothetical protein
MSPLFFGTVTWSSKLSDRSGALPFGLHYVDLRVLAFHFDNFLQADLHCYHILKRQQAEFKRTVTVGNRLEAEHDLALLWPAMQVVKR